MNFNDPTWKSVSRYGSLAWATTCSPIIPSTGYSDDLWEPEWDGQANYTPKTIYPCAWCGSVFEKSVVLEKGHCISCGAPLDVKEFI